MKKQYWWYSFSAFAFFSALAVGYYFYQHSSPARKIASEAPFKVDQVFLHGPDGGNSFGKTVQIMFCIRGLTTHGPITNQLINIITVYNNIEIFPDDHSQKLVTNAQGCVIVEEPNPFPSSTYLGTMVIERKVFMTGEFKGSVIVPMAIINRGDQKLELSDLRYVNAYPLTTN